jgi:asparagine synthase (glutamine-hydrolysing)
MCGILGSVNSALSEKVLDLIAARGPDDSGLESYSIGRHSVDFGHRRLAIVDLSPAGHQPMVSQCGRYRLIFNGEVYNHAEIRASLKFRSFRGHSDTETLLYALIERGAEALRSFNGIFSLAFLDENEQRLFLARDPFGVKPLYYRFSANKLQFGSELKPLLAMQSAEVDTASLAELLRLRYLPSPDTLFKDIRRLRPGHFLDVNLRGDNIRSQENRFLVTPPAETDMSFAEAQKVYGELFEQAVERQLMADVEVGVLLSGGVDSALVAANAAQRVDYPMKAFTVGFTQDDVADEIDDAAETASLLGLDHRVSRIGAEDFFGIMRKCVEIVEEPLATTSIIPMYYLSKHAAESVKVVMSGQGADEPLGGYGRYRGELIAPYFPSLLGGPARALAGALGVKKDKILRGLSTIGIRDDVDRFLANYSVFDAPQINRLTGVGEDRAREKIDYFYQLLDSRSRRRPVERMMGLDLRMNLADDLLLYTDKITMHHSLECRVPILDHELIRFAESLPAHYRLKLKQGKRIHKAYAEQRLPARVVHRPKKGFWSPTNIWFKDSGFLTEALLENGSRMDNYFDREAVSQVLHEHVSGFDRQRQIFLLLAIRHWLDLFG